VVDVLADGLATATSPGRLQILGTAPTVLVDAAHNPHGAAALAAALGVYFGFDEITFVIGILQDKDARGIIAALAPLATRMHVTRSQSDRAIPADELAGLVSELAGDDLTSEFDSFEEAIRDARNWAAEEPRRAVVVTGSITLVGEAIALAATEGWKR
jgi:dihydrofolate synthase/folylpolyglutamate synthase